MFARQLISRSQRTFQRRFFAGGHGHQEKHYEGFEATVRQYLPEDHHLVLGTLGAWFGVYVLFKLTRSKPKPVAEESSGRPVKEGKEDIPSVLSEKFDKWSQQPGNVAKWEKSIEKWEKQMEDPKYAAAYSKSIA